MIIPFRLVEITIIDKNLGICFKNNLSLGTQWYDHPETEILVREAFFSCNLVSSQSWHSSEKVHRIPLLHSGIPKAARFSSRRVHGSLRCLGKSNASSHTVRFQMTTQELLTKVKYTWSPGYIDHAPCTLQHREHSLLYSYMSSDGVAKWKAG